jgi:hypothetical protein
MATGALGMQPLPTQSVSANADSPTPGESAVNGITDRPPIGWRLSGTKPDHYVAGLDLKNTYRAQRSVYLMEKTPAMDGYVYGQVMQFFNAESYAGQRVRLRAAVRARDVEKSAGLWMRIEGKSSILAWDNMDQNPVKGTTDWKICDVVLDVPEEATRIYIGMQLLGSGKVWMSSLRFEVVKDTVPLTGSQHVGPVNLDFQK